MARAWHIRDRVLPIGERTLIMGILNVTPDSFSDGGQFASVDAALAHAEQMIAEGADIIDVGGESTRPGGEPVSVEDEINRVVPVIEALAQRSDVPISVDTTKSEVARAALDAAATMHRLPPVADIMHEVTHSLRASINMAERRGVKRESIVIDPGIGFGKSQEQNLELLAKLDQLIAAFPDYPLLIGTSRKSFIGRILADESGTPAPVEDRLHGTMATITTAILKGAHITRVHDVKATAETVRTVRGIQSANPRRVQL